MADIGYVTKVKPNLYLYTKNLNPKELIYTITMMDNLFNYKQMDKEKKVKFFVTKLKGHAVL